MVVKLSKSGSLVVASLTRSQVTAMVLRMDEAADTSSSSMLKEQESCGDSLVRILVRKGCPIRLPGHRWVELSMAAMSSGRVRGLGCVGPVGCREMASAALCRTPGMCTIRNLYRSVFTFYFGCLCVVLPSSDEV